ncbi:MAG TPA: hypothetical protein PK908_06205, partial [Bacteroidales bacterium]|nr:hypothetical protein [Bacteroidales bacterium]
LKVLALFGHFIILVAMPLMQLKSDFRQKLKSNQCTLSPCKINSHRKRSREWVIKNRVYSILAKEFLKSVQCQFNNISLCIDSHIE